MALQHCTSGPKQLQCTPNPVPGHECKGFDVLRGGICHEGSEAPNQQLQNCCGDGSAPASALCGACRPGYSQMPGKGCVKCETVQWSFIAVFVLGYGMFSLVLWNGSDEPMFDNLTTIIVTYFQFVALFAENKISVGTLKGILDAVFAIVNVQLDLFGNEGAKCMAPFTFTTRVLFTVVQMAFMFVPVTVLRIVRRNSHHAAREYVVCAVRQDPTRENEADAHDEEAVPLEEVQQQQQDEDGVRGIRVPVYDQVDSRHRGLSDFGEAVPTCYVQPGKVLKVIEVSARLGHSVVA